MERHAKIWYNISEPIDNNNISDIITKIMVKENNKGSVKSLTLNVCTVTPSTVVIETFDMEV